MRDKVHGVQQHMCVDMCVTVRMDMCRHMGMGYSGTCVHVHAHAHTHVYAHVYMCMQMCMDKCMGSHGYGHACKTCVWASVYTCVLGYNGHWSHSGRC